MKLQGIVIEKEDVAKIGNQFCNIPFFNDFLQFLWADLFIRI